MNGDMTVQKMMFEMEVCPVEGCDRPQQTRGYCKVHYARMLEAGVLKVIRQTNRMPQKRCSVEGCTKRAECKGYCGVHYSRIKAHGDPHWDRKKAYQIKKEQKEAAHAAEAKSQRRCTVEGCENQYEAKGYCKLHYNRVYRYGDPLFLKRESRPNQSEGAGKNENGIPGNEVGGQLFGVGRIRPLERNEPVQVGPVLLSVSTDLEAAVLHERNAHDDAYHGRTDPVFGLGPKPSGLGTEGRLGQEVGRFEGKTGEQGSKGRGLTISIPVWLLWVIGVPLGLFILFLAAIGFSFLWGWNRL